MVGRGFDDLGPIRAGSHEHRDDDLLLGRHSRIGMRNPIPCASMGKRPGQPLAAR